VKILFAGEGGQGVQVIAEMLAKAAFNESRAASFIPNFGVEQRGGVSLAFVIIQNTPVTYPKFDKADILAILSERSRARVETHIGPATRLILGPAVKGGITTMLPPKVWNIVVLKEVNNKGKLVQTSSLVRVMEERFKRQFQKNPELKKLDLKAIGE
jgi:2-oxoglutarate ferredoxin oxidoreductase subunit gamma